MSSTARCNLDKRSFVGGRGTVSGSEEGCWAATKDEVFLMTFRLRPPPEMSDLFERESSFVSCGGSASLALVGCLDSFFCSICLCFPRFMSLSYK